MTAVANSYPFADAASLNTASHWPEVAKGARDPDFLESFFEAHTVKVEDQEALVEWIQIESSKLWSERFHKLLAVFRDCKIPAAVVFSALVQCENATLLDLAKPCRVGKQGIYMHVLNQEAVLGELQVRNNYRRFGCKVRPFPHARNREAVTLLQSVMDFTSDIKVLTKKGLKHPNEKVRISLLQVVRTSLLQVEKILNVKRG